MKTVLKIIGALLGLIVLLILVSALSNIGLPTESSSVEILSKLDKARAAEAYQLRRELGGQIWPGWEEQEIPSILHNEAYAFLLAYPGQPPAGWVKEPSGQHFGGEWKTVPEEAFLGQRYFRTPLLDGETTPENFTVRVGEFWTATLFTKEYAEIAFYEGFQEELPGFLARIFPYRLFWKLAFGSSETYIEGLTHETFHSYQGIKAPDRLERAEEIAYLEEVYPWEDPQLVESWKKELDLLFRALQAESDEEALDLARQFLQQRQERRDLDAITPEEIDYERNREWLEGLAKYTELKLGLLASSSPTYQPVPGLSQDPDFNAYRNQDRYFKQQIAEIKRRGNQAGESRFYYSGMGQAFLLDRFAPGWKDRIWQDAIWLDDLLAEAVR
jgi:hypothetical protein